MAENVYIQYLAHMLDEAFSETDDLGDRSYYAVWKQEFPEWSDENRLARYMAGRFDRYMSEKYRSNLDALLAALADRMFAGSDRCMFDAIKNVFDPDEITDTGYFWPQIPAQVYKAVVSRNRAKAQGWISYEVSPKVLKDCLDDICCASALLKLNSLNVDDDFNGTAIPVKRELKKTSIYRKLAKSMRDRRLEDGSSYMCRVKAANCGDLAQYAVYMLYRACTSLSTYADSARYASVSQQHERDEIDGKIADWVEADLEYIRQFGGGEWMTNDTDNGVFDDILNEMKTVRYDVYEDSGKAIPLISKLIDQAHARGDLATAFVEGGAKTCWQTSNMKPDEIWESSSCFYDPPYSVEDVRRNYDEDTFNQLYNDPCHRWRMETGIELIHREPTAEEFYRILGNWKLMDDEMKALSDAKSMELFGIDNMTHAERLKRYYER